MSVCSAGSKKLAVLSPLGTQAASGHSARSSARDELLQTLDDVGGAGVDVDRLTMLGGALRIEEEGAYRVARRGAVRADDTGQLRAWS
jgi:hypothetical protein